MMLKRRNILTKWFVSLLALLAIAVPVAQAEPGGLFDGTNKPEQPVPYAWLLDQSQGAVELPNIAVDANGNLTNAVTADDGIQLPTIVVGPNGNLTNANPSDVIGRFIDGNAPAVPNAVPGYPALLPDAPTAGVTTDQLPALPPGPGGYVEPFTPPAGAIGPEGFRPAPEAPVTVVAEPASGGFDWRDAAIGFSVAAVLALLAAGMVMIFRNRGKVAAGTS